MNKELVIVFVKNIKLGTVKTRLAKTIGDMGAFEVYKELVEITEHTNRDESHRSRFDQEFGSDFAIQKPVNQVKHIAQNRHGGDKHGQTRQPAPHRSEPAGGVSSAGFGIYSVQPEIYRYKDQQRRHRPAHASPGPWIPARDRRR